MVNEAAAPASERRERPRAGAAAAVPGALLGGAKLNPLGDLHTLQHLSARLARALRPVFEPVLRRELRLWAEPLSVQRFADYRAERGERLTAWLPLAMGGAATGQALLALDGGFVLHALDLFFGGTGQVPSPLPAELSPAAEALVEQLGEGVAGPLAHAWEPLAPIDFTPTRVETHPATLADADDAVVVTRFGLSGGGTGDGEPAFVDILYPVASLKPHGATLAGKVVDKAEPDPAWRHRLTRAAMGVRLPVRSVLAEPVVPLSLLMALKVGDVIPIDFGPEVPVMIGHELIGTGTVGAANGHAAVRLSHMKSLDEGSPQ